MRYAIHTLTALAAVLLTAGCLPEKAATASGEKERVLTTGVGDFTRFCADCHGPEGKGNGPAAAGLKPRPADLTQLSRKNGGKFPRLTVMNRIDGYTMGKSDSPMPAFGDLLEGKTVLFDSGDGIETPTPWRLVALQRYVETLQK